MELKPEPPARPRWSDPKVVFTDARFDPSPYLHYYEERRRSRSPIQPEDGRAFFDWGRALEQFIREAFE